MQIGIVHMQCGQLRIWYPALVLPFILSFSCISNGDPELAAISTLCRQLLTLSIIILLTTHAMYFLPYHLSFNIFHLNH